MVDGAHNDASAAGTLFVATGCFGMQLLMMMTMSFRDLVLKVQRYFVIMKCLSVCENCE